MRGDPDLLPRAPNTQDPGRSLEAVRQNTSVMERAPISSALPPAIV